MFPHHPKASGTATPVSRLLQWQIRHRHAIAFPSVSDQRNGEQLGGISYDSNHY